MTNDFNQLLKDKAVLITGGARGMGAAECRMFTEQGARVFIADVLIDDGMAMAEEIGEAATFVHLDVSDEDNWRLCMETIQELYGGLDVLVNNAGILKVGTVEDTTLDDYMSVVQINQVGTFLGMRSVIPMMKARGGGAIVNISSSDGLTGANGLVAYAASKWAIRGMTKVAARELGQFGIRVNSVHPGGTKTAMTGGEMDVLDHDTAKMIPLYRAAEPEEIARTVLFLASEFSSYTSGAEVSVDGGLANSRLYEAMPGAPSAEYHKPV